MFTDNWMDAYERKNRYSWAIQLNETGDVVGRYFGMHPDDELRQVELACEIGQAWWNQGLMTEATKKIIDFSLKRWALIEYTLGTQVRILLLERCRKKPE